jgi:pimeloyl-ACP methyl ester carboxylesterase
MVLAMQNTFSAILLTALAACGACSEDKPGDGKTFVLVHGAFMNASGWEPVANELRERGATVRVVELGNTNAAATLDGYVERVRAVLGNEPVILVGHSMGGMVISRVAELQPKSVAKLAYVAAYVPQNEQSLLDLAYMDQDSQLGKNLQPHEDGTLDVATDAFPSLFCAECNDAQRAALVASYHAEPGGPLQTKVALSSAFASVPKMYVGTKHDLVVSPALQAQMIAATPMQKTLELPTGHVPMLSAPAQVADALVE